MGRERERERRDSKERKEKRFLFCQTIDVLVCMNFTKIKNIRFTVTFFIAMFKVLLRTV